MKSGRRGQYVVLPTVNTRGCIEKGAGVRVYWGNGQGMGADTGRGVTLWLIGGLVVASLVLLSASYESAMGRVTDQGNRCERTGPHPSGMAMWSDDGMETWHD